jgi:hypothetical protein
MAIDLDSGNGLFDRLGAMGYLLNVLNDFVGGSAADTVPKETNDVLAMYDAESNTIRSTVAGLLPGLTTFQATAGQLRTAIRTATQNTLIEMADADATLSARTVEDALDELVSQMISGSEDVDASTVSGTPAAGGSNVGTGAAIVSVKDGKGFDYQNILAETVEAVVTDASTSRAETWTVKGDRALTTDKLHHDWPSGSGIETDISTRNPSTDGSLTNGGFENFTGDSPDDWTVVAGTPGTDFEDETTIVSDGNSALRINGDVGGTSFTLTQDVTASVNPRTLYPVHVAMRKAASPTGTITIDLINDSSSVINDEDGNSNSVAIDVSTLTTSYASKTAVFILPDPLPPEVHLRIRSSTAITGASTYVYIDDLCLGSEMDSLYDGGPSVAFYAGETDFALDDTFTITIANDRAGEFQELFDKLFNYPAKLLPSDTGGGETIPDSLIA